MYAATLCIAMAILTLASEELVLGLLEIDSWCTCCDYIMQTCHMLLQDLWAC